MADDELNQNQNPEGEELEATKARIAELETLVAEKDEELESKDTRLNEAETLITELEQAVANSDEVMTNLKSSLAQAVSSYRALVVQANPGVVEELITGDSIEGINQSLGNARSLISRVKQGLEEEAFKTRVPAGAPQRTPPDLSALSPREKIQYAILHK